MKKKLAALILTLTFIFQMSFISLSSESDFKNDNSNSFVSATTEFISEFRLNKVDVSKLTKDELMSIMLQAKAYNFTDNQVRSLINSHFSDDRNKAGYAGVLSEDGKYYIYENGLTLPNRRIHTNNILLSDDPNDGMTCIYNSTEGYYECTKPSDQTGVYWAVKSNEGYTEATAFITLPDIQDIHSQDRPYMFLAANSSPQGNSLTFIGDYGVVYHPSGDEGAGWYTFINASQWNDHLYGENQGGYEKIIDEVFDRIPSNVTNLYLHIKVENGESTDKVIYTCRNADDFEQKFVNAREVVFNGNPVQPNATNLNLYHQTTLAQHSPAFINGVLNTNTGTKVYDAKFEDAFLYVTSNGTFFEWTESVTKKAYIQAPYSYMLSAVEPFITSKWNFDTVDIEFDIPLQ